jgi:hypothetical protein
MWQAEHGIERLAVELLPTQWLRVEFDVSSFEIDTEAAEAEAQRSFEHGLLRPLVASIEPLRGTLRPANVEKLVHTLSGRLAELMEESVLHKAFNECGAILLQEHTRKLIDTLSELVSGSVRNEFGRLNQVCVLGSHEFSEGPSPCCAALLRADVPRAAGSSTRWPSCPSPSPSP